MSVGRTVYVIGASGYVGSSIASRLGAVGERVIGTSHSNPCPSLRRFDFWSDDLNELDDDDCVIFAAQVERADRPVDEFDRRVASLTRACSDCRFVYVSSDAVYGGASENNTSETVPDPQTPYGRRTERFEQAIRSQCANYCILRPSYVYGYSGGVLDHRLRRTFQRLQSGDNVEYYDNMFKSPVEVNQFAEIVRRVFSSSFVGTLNAGGPRVSVYEFHRQAAAAFGAPLKRIKSDRMPPESPHPTDTSLDSQRLQQEFGLRPAPIGKSLHCSSVSDVLSV